VQRDSPSRDLLEGSPYRSVSRIGAGASGEVWEAVHQKLAKRVVIKILKPEHSANQDQLDRLRLEAQSLARLAHVNVVRVTDSGLTTEGRAYVVMQHLDGHTLREEIDSKRAMPMRRAVDIVVQLLAGLAAAHDIGIVHRDVKPENMLLCSGSDEGFVVKVLDFGLVKASPSPGGPSPLEDPTTEGVSVGTPRYFSPEQARALPVDARTDVYAAGLVLHAVLYGRGPFDDLHNVQELARAHAKTVPTLPRLSAAEPAATELRQILRRALEKAPDRRFQTAEEMARALRAVSEHLDAPPWLETPERKALTDGEESMPGRGSYAAVFIAAMLVTSALSSALLWVLR